MANPEHVEIVKKGAKAIEKWRQAHPSKNMDLRRAKLGGAQLTSADLREANLGSAHLRSARLGDANLIDSNLREADLSGAYLIGADLSRADLGGADLTGADLGGAYLEGASLGDAVLYETVFSDGDLSGVRGLESVQHRGPSAIDERTLRKSWPLPEAFLRGCGLSDELISFLNGTIGNAIEFYSCFISYSSRDDGFVRRLHADLQDNGVRCWFAPEDFKIGERIRHGIDEAIRLHDKLLLIFSQNSVRSEWVEKEVETALERERRQGRPMLFPIRLDEAVMRTRQSWAADVRRTRHIGDFRRWEEHDAYQQSFERLLRDLKAGEKPAK